MNRPRRFLPHLPSWGGHALAGLALGLLLSACGGGDKTPSTSVNAATPSSGTSTATSTSLTPTVALGVGNVVPITVNAGPPSAIGVFNIPFVSVTLCSPGSLVNCRTIDHVLVDTGSSGLRILSETGAGSLALPSVSDGNGRPLGECAQFADGFTWGSVRRADVRLAGEVASNLPVQLVGDGGSNFINVPSACRNTGSNNSTVAALGANGILGVGHFRQDCGSLCTTQTSAGLYYACSAGVCSGTTVPLANQVGNPVAAFKTHNNGVLVDLPAVADNGSTQVNGSLVLGIGTSSNNTLTGSARVYSVDGNGQFPTVYKGRTYSTSFLDTGSNGIFFPDSSLRRCTLSLGFYCPLSTTVLTATNRAATGSASTSVSFRLVNLDALASNVAAAPVGGLAVDVGTATGFDWGLPFFFGRKVFTAIEASSTPYGNGPYVAY